METWKYLWHLACTLNLQNDFTFPSPILLKKVSKNPSLYSYLHPVHQDGNIEIRTNNTIYFLCPASSVIINDFDYQKSYINASCHDDPTISEKQIKISCKRRPKPVAVKSKKKCLKHWDEYKINLEIDNTTINVLTICFDHTVYTPLYVKHLLYPEIANAQIGKRPSNFEEGNMFNLSIPLKTLFRKRNQMKTINKILGFKSNSTSVINPYQGTKSLTRGHLSPKRDHIYGISQVLTFHYLNVAPQWLSFNSGNWLTLERQIRKYAATRYSELVIYTGPHGVAKLRGANNSSQEMLFLYYNEETQQKAIPVPKYFWKVVYDPVTKAGVGFVGVNNPYFFDPDADIFCEDVCHEINWLTWRNRRKISSGYSFCCTVDEIREEVQEFPEFEVTALLT